MARLRTVPARVAPAPSRLAALPAAPSLAGSSRFRALYKTARWQKLRWRVLVDANFTCAMCGTVTADKGALVCDHVDGHPATETEEKFWAGPFQALCAPCHSGAKQSADAKVRME